MIVLGTKSNSVTTLKTQLNLGKHLVRSHCLHSSTNCAKKKNPFLNPFLFQKLKVAHYDYRILQNL